MSPNFIDCSIILNVIVPIKIPAEKEARSARNLNGCLYSLEMIDAIRKGDATDNDTLLLTSTILRMSQHNQPCILLDLIGNQVIFHLIDRWKNAK